MNLSYSSISTYQKCPLSYKLRYIDKLPTKKTPALSFGGSIHAALEFMYNVPTPNPPALEEVLRALVEHWKSEGYEDEIDERNHLEHARGVIERFYLANVPSFAVPVVLEHKFFIDVDGINLTGVVDRIDKLPSGGYEIIDYKTSKRLPPKSTVEENLQLSIYHLAVESVWGFAPEKLSLYFVLPNQKFSSSRTPERIQGTKEIILRVADGIDKGDFPAVENRLCPWCDFQRKCPYHEDEYAFQAEQEANSPNDIRDLVDEYIENDRKQSEGKAAKDRLKSLILEYCDAGGYAKVFGSSGAITRSDQKRYSYDVEALRRLLEPAGLWESVIGIDKTLLGQLLKSPDVGEDVKLLIETTKQLESTSPTLRISKTPATKRNKA